MTLSRVWRVGYQIICMLFERVDITIPRDPTFKFRNSAFLADTTRTLYDHTTCSLHLLTTKLPSLSL